MFVFVLDSSKNPLNPTHPPDYGEGGSERLFTNNETNHSQLFGISNDCPYVKDGINDYVVQGHQDAINPDRIGTKFSARYLLSFAPGKTKVIRLRLSDQQAFAEPAKLQLDRLTREWYMQPNGQLPAEDIASKFFEHFLYIADAIDDIGDADIALWDEENVEHQARGGQGGDA